MLTTFLRSAGDYTSNYWFHGMEVGGYKVGARSIALLSGGDIVAAGPKSEFSSTSSAVWRLTRHGRLVWLYEGNTSGNFQSVHAGSGDAIFLSGTDGSTGVDIQKWTSGGSAITWQKQYDTADPAPTGAFDSSDNAYTGGADDNGTYKLALAAKFNSSGTLQWDRTLGGGTLDYRFDCICVDGSGNVYGVGEYSNTFFETILAKYNSSGTIQWQRKLAKASTNVRYGACATDSSGNLYIAGGGAGDGNIAKYNSSGALQWQKALTGADFHGLHITSDDRIFALGERTGGTGTKDALIVEYNTSGAVQWQNMFGKSATTIQAWGAKSSGDALVVALTTGVLRIPNDGTKTGTWGSYVYQASALSETTSTYTSSTTSLTDAAVTITESTPAHSPASLSPTEDRTVFRP